MQSVTAETAATGCRNGRNLPRGTGLGSAAHCAPPGRLSASSSVGGPCGQRGCQEAGVLLGVSKETCFVGKRCLMRDCFPVN